MRLQELDALRGIAALAVVIYHFTTRFNELYGFEQAPLFSLPGGSYGVHLFFVISGFVIFMTLEKCKHPMDFVVSRFARLYPVFWLAVIITFSVVSVFGLPGREVTFVQMLANLTMLNGFVGIPDVDAVYWTLRWELVFYFIMFALFLCKSLKFIVPLALGALALQTATLLILPEFSPGRTLNYLLLYKYGSLFFAGIFFYLLHNQRISWPFVVLACLLAAFNMYLLHGPGTAIANVAIFGVFFLFVYGHLTRIVCKPLVFLGAISYSLYLVHEYAGWVLMREMLAAGANVNITVLTALVASLVVATLMTYIVERPVANGIRHTYKTRIRTRLKTD